MFFVGAIASGGMLVLLSCDLGETGDSFVGQSHRFCEKIFAVFLVDA
jgi:hypothetical protein